jgi:hypothetical protein
MRPQQGILGKAAPLTQAFGNANPGVEVFSHGVNSGADFGAPVGTTVALPQGRWQILQAFAGDDKPGHIGDNTNEGYGNSVLAQNLDTGEKLRFSHLSQVGVLPGQTVDGGLTIGATGDTGNVTGPHLDLEYYNQLGQLADVLKSRYGIYLNPTGQGAGGTGGGNPLGAFLDAITQAGGNFVKGYTEDPSQTPGDGSLESFGNFLANGTPSGEATGMIGQGLHALSQVGHAAPVVGHAAAALPLAAGALRDAAPTVKISEIPGVKYRNIEDLIAHEATDPKRVAAYKALIQQGGEIPPLMTTPENGLFGVEDGKHRLEAMKQLGQRFAPTLNLNTLTQEQSNAYNQAADLAHALMQRFAGAK